MLHQAWTRGIGLKLTVALVAVVAVSISLRIGRGPSSTGRQPEELPPYRPMRVPTNCGEEIPDGFRGEVHPVLHGETRLEVTAHWTAVGQGRDQLETTVPSYVYSLFTNLRAATPRQVYTEREFSALMPESAVSVGQTWEIDGDGVAQFLRQLHPRPSLHLVALGRRAGPDGAFALLRAVSPTHLDIVFRIHAEFDIIDNVWFTPACFWGRMVIDKESGTVQCFRMWVPTDNPLNVHLTVAESIGKGESSFSVFHKIERGDMVISKRDIVRVERLELVSENQSVPDSLDWPESIDMDSAQHKLKTAFYTFTNIDWVPWNQAPTVAGVRQKPILAIVLWGALDDQSC